MEFIFECAHCGVCAGGAWLTPKIRLHAMRMRTHKQASSDLDMLGKYLSLADGLSSHMITYHHMYPLTVSTSRLMLTGCICTWCIEVLACMCVETSNVSKQRRHFNMQTDAYSVSKVSSLGTCVWKQSCREQNQA